MHKCKLYGHLSFNLLSYALKILPESLYNCWAHWDHTAKKKKKYIFFFFVVYIYITIIYNNNIIITYLCVYFTHIGGILE